MAAYKFSPDVLAANAHNPDFIDSFGDPKSGRTGGASFLEVTAVNILNRLSASHNLPLPARELKFNNGRKWRFDFAYTEQRIAIEIEGGTRGNGRHNRHAGYRGDCEKYNAATLDGWHVYRFTSDMVMDGTLADTVAKIFN